MKYFISSNNFVPEAGTITEHQAIIAELGFVWYGKLGTAVSSAVTSQILENEEPKILLIHSGAAGRYWAYIDAVQKDTPELFTIPVILLRYGRQIQHVIPCHQI